MKIFGRLAVLVVGLMLTNLAFSDSPYPTKPIKFVVAYAPGGGTDIIARVIGQELAKAWNTPVVIENRPGAGSNVGTQVVARSAPDGYTILVTSSPFAINPTLYKNAGYNASRDFVPIINAGHSPTILVVHPSVPANNLQEFIALAKVQSLSYSSAGIGTVPFLTGEYLLKTKAGIDIVHAPYGGAGPALNAVVAGHVPVGSLAFATPGLENWISTGKLKAIVVTSTKRLASLPTVATASESGFPGYVDVSWIGFLAPAGTPKEITTKMNLEMGRILQLPAIKDQLEKIGFEWQPNTAAEFSSFIQEEITRWAEIVKVTGAKAD